MSRTRKKKKTLISKLEGKRKSKEQSKTKLETTKTTKINETKSCFFEKSKVDKSLSRLRKKEKT